MNEPTSTDIMCSRYYMLVHLHEQKKSIEARIAKLVDLSPNEMEALYELAKLPTAPLPQSQSEPTKDSASS